MRQLHQWQVSMIGAVLILAPGSIVRAQPYPFDPTKVPGIWTGAVGVFPEGWPEDTNLTFSYESGTLHGTISYPNIGCSGDLRQHPKPSKPEYMYSLLTLGYNEPLFDASMTTRGNGSPLCSNPALLTVHQILDDKRFSRNGIESAVLLSVYLPDETSTLGWKEVARGAAFPGTAAATPQPVPMPTSGISRDVSPSPMQPKTKAPCDAGPATSEQIAVDSATPGGVSEPSVAVNPSEAAFTWSMAPRLTVSKVVTQPDGNNSILDYPSADQICRPGPFEVTFNVTGCIPFEPVLRLIHFVWTIDTQSAVTSQDCDYTAQVDPGIHNVQLNVQQGQLLRDAEPVTVASNPTQINVRNVLIVSIGDSVASGEGNPDINGECDQIGLFLGGGGSLIGYESLKNPDFETSCIPNSLVSSDNNKPPVWQASLPVAVSNGEITSGRQDIQCHRSTQSGTAQAASFVEGVDDHSSVTFLHVACSGASVKDGLLGKYGGIEQDPPGSNLSLPGIKKRLPDLPAQLEQVKTAIGGQRIDALLVSIGGNDVHFGTVIDRCINAAIPKVPPDFSQKDCADSDSTIRQGLERDLAKALPELGRRLDALSGCLGNQDSSATCPEALNLSNNVEPQHVFITQYYDPTHNQDRQFCTNEGYTILKPGAFEFAYEKVVLPLNDQLNLSAYKHGWNLVSDAAVDFEIHGYCVDQNHEKSGTWIVQLGDDFQFTGNRKGFFHPNHWGHQYYAARIADALEKTLFDGA